MTGFAHSTNYLFSFTLHSMEMFHSTDYCQNSRKENQRNGSHLEINEFNFVVKMLFHQFSLFGCVYWASRCLSVGLWIHCTESWSEILFPSLSVNVITIFAVPSSVPTSEALLPHRLFRQPYLWPHPGFIPNHGPAPRGPQEETLYLWWAVIQRRHRTAAESLQWCSVMPVLIQHTQDIIFYAPYWWQC